MAAKYLLKNEIVFQIADLCETMLFVCQNVGLHNDTVNCSYHDVYFIHSGLNFMFCTLCNTNVRLLFHAEVKACFQL